MASSLIQVALGMLTVLFVVALVVLTWSFAWPMRWRFTERAEPTLDREICELRDRLRALEGAGPGTWRTQLVLWRQRRRLMELCHRRRRLQAAADRLAAQHQGVRRGERRDRFQG